MSLRERVLTVLAIVAVVGVVVYPLSHRISTNQANTSMAPGSVRPASAPPASATVPLLPTPAPPSPEVEDLDPWFATAMSHRGADGRTFTYVCPADGSISRVWGSSVYTDDSSVCSAAVHAGIITLEEGGTIDIVILAGADAYEGSDQNGVASEPFGWWPGSFVVVAPAR